MHISEGILSAPVLITGAALAVAGTSIGLKKLDYDRIPQVAVLSAAFFVASLIHIPIGPVSSHLVLHGLLGVFLGWAAFPAILIGLILQAILFQFGGLTSLGINCLNMALPALICYQFFGKGIRSENNTVSMVSSFSCGALAVLLSCILVAYSLVFTGEQFSTISKIVVIAHIPVIIAEGFITALCVRFIKRVKPEILEGMYAG